MKNELSILIPCYNCRCGKLVNVLHALLKKEEERHGREAFKHEIIVADDGSTDTASIEENKHINSLDNCRYVIREKNTGRSAIRNFLAREAKYKWLLFMDSDMAVNDDSFIERYLSSEGNVIVGGIRTGGDVSLLKNNIRYKYERTSEKCRTADRRNMKSHKEFRTTNFLIAGDIIKKYPFNEEFVHYGYEDVLFGKNLYKNNIDIIHIDNPVTLEDYEENEVFINKTEEALRTLHMFKDSMQGYSTLLDCVGKINSYGLTTAVSLLYKLAGKSMKRNLSGKRPVLFLFNIYKLCYYISLK